MRGSRCDAAFVVCAGLDMRWIGRNWVGPASYADRSFSDCCGICILEIVGQISWVVDGPQTSGTAIGRMANPWRYLQI